MAPTIGICVDHRRRNRSEESLEVRMLVLRCARAFRLYRSPEYARVNLERDD